MLIIQKIIEKYNMVEFIMLYIIFIAIIIIIDLNFVMKKLRVRSKNYSRLKVCAMEIFSFIILVKIFFVLTVDLVGRKNIICNLYFLIFTIISKLVVCVLNHKLNLYENREYKYENQNVINIVFSVLMIFVFFNVVIIKILNDYNYLRYVFLNTAIMLYLYSNFEFLMWIKKTEKQSIKIHVLESRNRNLSVMYDNMRGFRHDFSNIIQALDGYAKTNDIEGVKLMCESLTEDYKKIKNMEIIESNIINNSAVGWVLTNKYFSAIKENITVNIECLIDLSETKEYSYEFCRILAILLDNAIEAARQSDKKIINIKIFKDIQVNRKLIIIENTYNQVDIDLDKIFEKGYSSKEDKENKHGLGLWTVRKILSKSNRLDLFTTKDEMFRQQLEIYI